MAALFVARADLLDMGISQQSGAAYQGPGDVVSGAIAFWGFRCYNTAYAGNVADIWDSSTGSTTETQLTCSAGGTVNQTINTLATTCASGCKVKTFTDQTGNGNTLTQATNANRPVISLTASTRSRIGATCTGASSLGMTGTWASGNQSQPVTITAMATRTSGTSQVILLDFNTDNIQLDFRGANIVSIFANTTFQDATQTDGSQHAFTTLVNGASSLINVDGVDGSSGVNIGSAVIGANQALCQSASGSLFVTGTFYEGGAWPIGFSAGQRTNMATNMTGYY